MALEPSDPLIRSSDETSASGIGEEGKTLKQMLAESQQLLRETGCYAGIAKPEALRSDPVKAELVKLRFFAGLTLDEAAKVLGISPATADRHWSYARAWLYTKSSRKTPRIPESCDRRSVSVTH